MNRRLYRERHDSMVKGAHMTRHKGAPWQQRKHLTRTVREASRERMFESEDAWARAGLLPTRDHTARLIQKRSRDAQRYQAKASLLFTDGRARTLPRSTKQRTYGSVGL